ncbi:MAG: 30S ribosomal protein S9 [Patescibacteria group bacterium]|nr:30S ribosomal protein S9 [Patescibacteria group bacterium]MDE2213449.1 30S ribosomal protein S9 [Patescibacteria group bacterium]
MATKDIKYIESVGRRKTAIARARITPGGATAVSINGKELNRYFATESLRSAALGPFLKVTLPTQFSVSVHVRGGGPTGQAEAVRHAIARALVSYEEGLRGDLKKLGFLKRDPRAKERRKFGLKKARKSPQWSKR